MIGYKLVQADLSSLNERLARVQYKIAERAYRPAGCGPLAVFYSYRFALDLALQDSGVRMFHCVYLPSADSALWNTRLGVRFSPLGTAYADWVTLIREIAL